MRREQFLLMKLSEECAEVSQRALKQIQFGWSQVQKADEVAGGSGPVAKEAGLSNARRLTNEIIDLMSIVQLLQEAGEVECFSITELEEAKARKVAKMNKYLKFSNSLGTIPEGFKI